MDISRKRPIPETAVRAAEDAARKMDRLRPKSLPATVKAVSGSFVTVTFEVQGQWTIPERTIPIFGAQYIRQPIQPGDSGVVLAMDATVAGVSGQTEIIAQMVQQGALSSLVFLPISNQKWANVDPDMLCMWGPDGVSLYDKAKGTVFTLTSSSLTVTSSNGSIELSAGGASIKVGSGQVQVTGDLIINGMQFSSHTHSNGNQGAPTGPVIG